jgi:hypothetical protein
VLKWAVLPTFEEEDVAFWHSDNQKNSIVMNIYMLKKLQINEFILVIYLLQ